MGVPALFRWLSQKYPKIVSPVIEEVPDMVDGQEVPVDTTKPNPNGEEMDNLYLDMNGIVHPCTHPENRPPPETEEEMMLEVFKYTDRVVNMVRPRKLLMIAVDGVAPRAKMNQQRSRRFRSARDAKEKADETAEFIKLLEKQGTTFEDAIKNKKVWDSNAITPGTPFMDILALSLRYWCAYKLNTDPMWAQMKVIISDSTVPGEGEHKIMEFIRSQRADPEHDPNTRHVIYGLDADLIMLGLATHEPHFRVLREDVFLNEGRVKSCDLCGQKGHRREECTGKVKEKQGEFDEKSQHQKLKPFIWLHVEIFREYLAIELDIPGQGFKLDLERAIDDWVFLCFFVGNDFLPHLPSLEIRDGGIDTLIQIWKDNLPAMGGYITKDGDVNLERAQYILDGLAKQEDAIFRRRRDGEERREANAKRRRLNEQRNGSNGAPNGGPNGGGYTGLSYQNAIYKKPTPGPTPIPTPTDTTIPVPKNKKINPESIPHPDIPLIKAGDTSKATRKLNHDMILHRDEIRKANLENKSAAAALRASLLSGKSAVQPESTPDTPLVDHTQEKEDLPPSPVVPSKRKADESPKPELIPDVSLEAEGHPDTVRLWEPGYADRYYEQKFKVDKTDHEFRRKVAAHYVEGLCWVLKYYFQGCPSWTWYYPYHYAPFAADFKDMGKLDINFEKGKPFKPFEQLMGVLPAASKHNLPEPFQKLMTDEDSEIIDFYPEEFPIDMNGKKMSWQGIALLPFIDEQRLLEAAQKIYPQLTSVDAARNALGHDVLLISEENPIYNDVVDRFYSKKKDHTKYKIKPKNSAGLSGTVIKDPLYIPRSTHSCPLSVGEMPDLHDDRSMSLQYKMPKSKNIHKSMLLNGVKFNPPVLTRADIETTRARAQSGGRSYGGSQLYRGGSGRGRGGNNFSGSFRSDRPPQGNDSYRPQQNQYGPPSGRGGHGGYQGYPPPPPPGSWAGGFDSRGGPPPPGNYGQWPPAPPPGVRLGNTYAGPPPGQSYNPRGGSYSGYNNRKDDYGRGGYGGGRGYSR